MDRKEEVEGDEVDRKEEGESDKDGDKSVRRGKRRSAGLNQGNNINN